MGGRSKGEGVRALSVRLGLPALIERLDACCGATGILRDLTLRLRHRDGSADSRAILADYLACRGAFRRLARGAPKAGQRGTAWMVASMPWVWCAKLDGGLSLVLREAGYRVQVLEPGYYEWCRPYHRLVGNHSFAFFPHYFESEPVQEEDLQAGLEASRGFTVPELLDLHYREVDIGRVVLSSLTYRNKLKTFDITDPATRQICKEEMVRVRRAVRAAERLVNECRPALVMAMEKGLAPVAEIVGVCLARGVPVVQYVSSHENNGFPLKRFHKDNRHDHPFSLDRTTWERVKTMPWNPADERAVMDELTRAYAAGTWFNRKFLHAGKRIKSPEEVRTQLGLDPAKKTAVVFSHVLWDATFFYGHNLFADYETWLMETVRAACANPSVNWVVKLHPDLVWKLKYEDFAGELHDVIAMRSKVGRLPSHVKLVMPETDISTYSFFAVTDWCLTVRGTVGIEMACHGVPVITAGTGRYSGLGFTVDSAMPDDYLALLAGIQNVPAMTSEQTELARRFAYALFLRRSWMMHSFELVREPLNKTGNVLDTNVALRVPDYARLSEAQDVRDFAAWLNSGVTDYMQARP
jgi:hypothetical protein